MSTKAIAQFFAAVEADAAVQAQLKATTSEQDIVRLAQAQGYHFSAADLRAGVTSELSEEPLDAVAGGQLRMMYHGCRA
jgi:predicted ribosomally synthesized peptide with nif11-like leader